MYNFGRVPSTKGERLRSSVGLSIRRGNAVVTRFHVGYPVFVKISSGENKTRPSRPTMGPWAMGHWAMGPWAMGPWAIGTMGILSTFSTFSTLSTFSTFSTFSNVKVGLPH